jgi:hypothetical protein
VSGRNVVILIILIVAIAVIQTTAQFLINQNQNADAVTMFLIVDNTYRRTCVLTASDENPPKGESLTPSATEIASSCFHSEPYGLDLAILCWGTVERGEAWACASTLDEWLMQSRNNLPFIGTYALFLTETKDSQMSLPCTVNLDKDGDGTLGNPGPMIQRLCGEDSRWMCTANLYADGYWECNGVLKALGMAELSPILP